MRECKANFQVREKTDIDIIHSTGEMQQKAEQIRCAGKTIAFVPTMGYLHDGHLSLMQHARGLADRLVVSIFVNPTQFGPNEDLDKYPRDLERDLRLAGKAGVDLVYTPAASDLYPDGFETYVTQSHLPDHLCGLSRPGHFRGVTTVVTKLFHIVKPHFAVFGQKDFQQLAIIRKMTRDLNFDIAIIGCPTVRESDGLAMSSRNKHLSSAQRQSAASLYRALSVAAAQVTGGETSASTLVRSASAIISEAAETAVDYIRICDPGTLEDMNTVDRPALIALAVRVGDTRLIDNMMLMPPDSRYSE